MPPPRTKRPRQVLNFSSLSPPSSLHQKKVIGNREVQVFVFVIVSMAAFPLLFLHRYITSPSSFSKHQHQKNETRIQNSLNEYYKQRQEHRQNHNDWKPKEAPFSRNHDDNQNVNDVSQFSQGTASDKVLTAYLEPVDTMPSPDSKVFPLPIRQTSAERLKKVVFPPSVSDKDQTVCSRLMQDFPIDDFPLEDPYLPWIHDYFPSEDNTQIQFVAQNKRRCATGEGNEKILQFWEPQVALFQSIPVRVQRAGGGEQADDPMTFSAEDDFFLSSDLESATHKATRFQCHFHTNDGASLITLSEYNFDYEFINWRKGRRTMIHPQGKDLASYWLSQLLFKCPVPVELQHLLTDDAGNLEPKMYLDLVPIRTLPRSKEVLFTTNTTGPVDSSLLSRHPMLDLKKTFGEDHRLPKVQDAGRVCPIESVLVRSSFDLILFFFSRHTLSICRYCTDLR